MRRVPCSRRPERWPVGSTPRWAGPRELQSPASRGQACSTRAARPIGPAPPRGRGGRARPTPGSSEGCRAAAVGAVGGGTSNAWRLSSCSVIHSIGAGAANPMKQNHPRVFRRSPKPPIAKASEATCGSADATGLPIMPVHDVAMVMESGRRRRPGSLRSRGASCQGRLSGISPIWHGVEPADDAPENQPAVPIPDGLDSPQVVAWAMAPRPWWLAMSTDAHARALRIVPSPG